MISNPYLPSPSAGAAWADGFLRGLSGPAFTPPPPATLDAYDAQAYADGVLQGQAAAIDGFALDDACVSAAEEPPPGADEFVHVVDGAHLLHATYEGFAKKAALGWAGLAVTLIELACSLPRHTVPADQILPHLGQPIADALSDIGAGSLELFCGAGIDAGSTNCEIKLSPLLTSIDRAREAAVAMGRPGWIVVSWRTDACGSFRVVDAA